MANPWMEHVKKTKAENPSLSFKEVLVKAGKTYKSKAEKGAAAKKKTAKKSGKKSGKKKVPRRKSTKKKKKSGKKK